MKKKGNKKVEEKKDEKVVDKNLLLNEISQYLKISEKENKLKEEEKKKENEEFEKLKNKNNELLSQIKEIKESGNIEALFSKITKNSEIEIEIKNFKEKNENLSKESSTGFFINKLANTNLINANMNLSEAENINKNALQKLQILNDEKKKIIAEEQIKFTEISRKCENFMNDIKSKIDGSMPDKEVLLAENQNLKAQLEEAIKAANDLKESLEKDMKDKETVTQKVEEELRVEIKNKMEEITFTNQKYMIENMELKNQNLLYAQKFEEVNKSISQSNEIFGKMKQEIQKRKDKINQMEKENSEMKAKEKKNDLTLCDIGLEVSHFIYSKYENLRTENENIAKEINDLSLNVKALNEKFNNLKNSKSNN